jgi:hypothetical protein
MGKDHRLKKLARTLLATTCLTAATGAANAGTFVESSFAGGDFSNNLSSPSVLNATYDTVSGTLETPCCTDSQDYFQIPGLIPGASYHLTFSFTGPLPLHLTLYDGLSSIAGPFSGSANTNITAPLDSDLRFGIDSAEGPSTWTVGFATNAPEPGTMGLAATALASALALRRRRKN